MADTPEIPSTEATPHEPPAPNAQAAPEPVEPSAEAQAEPASPAANDMGPAACAAALAQHFPALFGTEQPPRPIKLRIQQDIQARAPGVFSRRALGVFFHRHTNSTPYLRALVASDARYDLDGQAAGEVAAEHKEAAQVELARRKAIVDERRAAMRQAQREAQRSVPRRANAGPAGGSASGAVEPAAAQAGMPAPSSDEAAAAAPPRAERHARPPRPPQAPRPGRAPQGLRPDRGPHHRRDERPARPPRAQAPAAEAPATPADPALREQTLLVRAWQSSPLTKPNFCALARVSEAELDAAIALVQASAKR